VHRRKGGEGKGKGKGKVMGGDEFAPLEFCELLEMRLDSKLHQASLG
jgi:hypothetical protein